MPGWTTRNRRRTKTKLGDVGLFVLRASVGTLLAAHGAQKLFGAFGGHGVKGTARWLESLGLTPGEPWSVLAGITEFAGGALMACGLFSPLGELGIVGSMATASGTAHRGKPIWVTKGGAELPLTNIAIASSLMFSGPGAISLDSLLGVALPRWIALPGLALVGAVAGAGVTKSVRAEEQEEKRIAGSQLPMPEAARLA